MEDSKIIMQIGYIDFSKEERDKVLATLKLLETPTALDELGIGQIRDAFANILFPGLSTIQTRAKYYVTIPYIFKEAEKQRFSKPIEVRKWVNDMEDKMVKTFLDKSPKGSIGIIGSDSLTRKNKTVKLKPSSIYWTGLKAFSILKDENQTIDSVCSIIYRKSQRKREQQGSIYKGEESFDDVEAMGGEIELFSPLRIDYDDFQRQASIELNYNEAKFLMDKITTAECSKNSLLSFMLKNDLEYESFDAIQENDLPDSIRQVVIEAKLFSDFIYGAHLRYNVILSHNLKSEDQNMIDSFEKWERDTRPSDIDLYSIFNRLKIHSNSSLAKFCLDFLEYIQEKDLEKVDKLIISREKSIKGSRAKLNNPELNYKPIHDYKLYYRFGRAKVIIKDIMTSLEKGENV